MKKGDLLAYVPNLKELIRDYGLDDDGLFVMTPVEETYDEYKSFLISELYGKRLGYFNEKYDATTSVGAISNQVKKDITRNAIKALIYACIGMIIYITLFEILQHMKHQNNKNNLIGIVIGTIIFLISMMFHSH